MKLFSTDFIYFLYMNRTSFLVWLSIQEESGTLNFFHVWVKISFTISDVMAQIRIVQMYMNINLTLLI